MSQRMRNISLAWRFLIWFVIVALLPLSLFGYLSLRQSEEALRNETLNRMSRLADKKTLQIKAYLAERMQDARLLAHGRLAEEAFSDLSRAYARHRADSVEYRRAAKPFEKNFSAYIGKSEDTLFYDVFLITPQGEIIYTYKHEPDFATNLIDGPYRDSQLAKVFRESRMTLESGISDFEYYAPSNAPAAFISAPIIREGKLLGVVAFQLDTQHIYQVAMDNIGLGATGETALAKLTGVDEAVFVAPLRRDPQAAMQRKIDLKTTATPMRNALVGQRGSGVETDYSGKQVVAAWRYLPELRWGMVVKMDTDEAFAPIYRQREYLLEMLLVLAMLGGFAAFYFGRQMVRRLKGFAQNADEIAQGDLGKRVDESGADEIGALARSFNRMTGNLQTLYHTLEDRVEERTRELNVTNEQLQEEIIEREHIEKSLLESQLELQHNQDLLNEAQRLGKLGSWELNLVSGRLRWSDEIYRIFELDPAQFEPSYENFLGAIHPEDRDKVNQAYTQSLENRQPYDVVHRLLFADGRIKWVREHCTSEFDASGKPLRSVGAVQDITEHHLAEEQLRIAAATFETHEAILITDANANIIRVNQAFQDITGYSMEEVLGKNPRILNSGRQDKEFYTAMWQQLLATGTWTGEMWDRRKDGQIYPKWLTITAVKNEQGQITEYVAIFSDITERKQAEEEIHYLAFYDALTDLPNRRLLLDRFRLALSVSARSHHYGAVLFLDMDKFKTLNDTLGHDYGDLMLIEVAKRVQFCVREVDTVARLGGDEFVVLLEEVDADAEEASQKIALIAEKIRVALVAPYLLKDREHHSSPSIGICLYRGNEAPVDVLLKHADMAMYQAKEAGRNAVRFFDPAMQHAVETHAAIEADLRRAVSGQQLRLYYQIQVDSDHRPLGAEALVRWVHPKRGMVSPAQFIPIAEESSLIFDVGHWVLDAACRQIALWSKRKQTRDLVLAVNVSAQQFRKHDFVENVATVAHAHQIDISRLKLELTESVILTDVADIVKKMHALKTLGVKLSLDDFGTGYSSLSYLKQLPLDQLKIDQSFVRDIATNQNDAVMVQTIIGMARNFSLNVIAEGVETEAQLEFLKQNDCMAYQGYLFGRPVPIEEFEALLGVT
ncbi:MAG: EAL domain-containing protein [Gallionella sp.]|nr:EAL domain-containing protein [Gallionella sp.]